MSINSTSAFHFPAPLDPVELTRDLKLSRVGSAIICFGEIGSTNDYARRWALDGAPDGATVFAERQTNGRGRRGRTWESPAGLGVLTSIILRQRPPGSDVACSLWLPALGALAVRDSVFRVTGLVPQLKWPNDVYLGGRKLAGVLAESPGLGKPVILGIGLNVLESPSRGRAGFTPDVASRSTSLWQVLNAESAAASTRTQPVKNGRDLRLNVARELLTALDALYEKWLEPGGPEFIARVFRESLSTLSQRIVVHEHQPTACWEGTAVDLLPDGALLVVDGAGREHRLTSGGTSIRHLA